MRSLRFTLSICFTLLVLAAISVISIVSNLIISSKFEEYVEEQQDVKAANLVRAISSHYSPKDGGWNIDYVHGMGMYALEDGFVVKLYDKDGNVLWDAQNHDMTLCHEVMHSISVRMREERPELEGDFVTHSFPLEQSGMEIGSIDISYYSPYYMDENDFQFITALNHILTVVGGVSLFGAMMMGILLANYLVKPIAKVVEITRQISDGDYSTKFKEKICTKELQELAHAVNQMAESLEEQEALRKRLTSDVAHELRTPVANVSSYIEMMVDEVMIPTPERLQSCYDELQRLSSLISDLERLRQVESENLILDKTEVDLHELAQTVMGNFESRLREKHLDGRVMGEPCTVSVDRGRMQQVILNLVSNAVKYSGSGGIVRVIVEDTKDSGVIMVEDTGMGIPQEDLIRVFERFYRTDKSRNRKSGGVGIGLAIAKTIVQAHKGTITAESEEGKGSRFTVTLPKRDGIGKSYNR